MVSEKMATILRRWKDSGDATRFKHPLNLSKAECYQFT